jgi:TldD protein
LLSWCLAVAVASAIDVEAVVSEELARAMATLAARERSPHHISVTVSDVERLDLSARDGVLAVDERSVSRWLDVDVRVGTPALDSTHPLRGLSAYAADAREPLRVAYAGPGEELALRHALWRELDRGYRTAEERIVLLEANRTVRIEEENPAPDFEPREAVVDRQAVPALVVDREAWQPLLREVSALLDRGPEVYSSEVRLQATRESRTQVDTEGTRLVHGRLHARLGMEATAVADDGERVTLFRAVDVHDPASLPEAQVVLAEAASLVRELESLRTAPRVGSYTGPVILTGRAAAVFFHEVMGHRVEGHRQKQDDEGKTFLDHLGKPVLPAWIDVYDDPGLVRYGEIDLNGHYRYDDEGVPGQRAELVDDGIFRGFLMSRSPLQAFPHSNGHGRRSPGNVSQARMGNTIVEASRTVSSARLEAMLREELRKQQLPFGYVVEEIDGGFTMTGRVMPNAFNVRASVTRRVWADGRPDELVRGIDLVGTPLVAFRSILAADDRPEVFNGTCGAESGWVPVSAVAPAMLFSRLEFQLKEKSSQRPPLLPRPSRQDATTDLGEVSR